MTVSHSKIKCTSFSMSAHLYSNSLVYTHIRACWIQVKWKLELTVFPLLVLTWAFTPSIRVTTPSIHAKSGSSTHTCEPTIMTGAACKHYIAFNNISIIASTNLSGLPATNYLFCSFRVMFKNEIFEEKLRESFSNRARHSQTKISPKSKQS